MLRSGLKTIASSAGSITLQSSTTSTANVVVASSLRRHLHQFSGFGQRQRQSGLSGVFGRPQVQVTPANVSVRQLNIHEYQSQQLLQANGINVPRSIVVHSPEEIHSAAEAMFKLPSPNGGQVMDVVVKAQVLAGGRGLGVLTSGMRGGVHICHSPKEVEEKTLGMLGHRLITKQTGARGSPVNNVLLAERLYSRREMYVAFVMDRTSQGMAFVGSTRGGVNIEKVAHDEPNAIFKIPIDPAKGLTEALALEAASRLGFTSNKKKAADQFLALYKFFIAKDCTQVEINPFIETPTGEVVCIDAKVNFDPNAEFRQKDIFALHDPSQDDPRELAAKRFELNYIGLEGNVGCLVNGAGLAMATMDVIKLKGGEPANFLDVGGGANEQQVYEALKIMSDDEHVQAILVNIFGGIMRCDTIAAGLIAAVNKLGLKKPLVVRLKGTNQAIALRLIEQSGLRIIPADDLNDAAKKAVHIANITHIANSINVRVKFEL
eukprot:c12906_g1_i1.p1 GENE.c12906_g1_i1~~c12906_g1_i1.p1  ORF type:complete len:506 (+),score=159.01 c12906_g1_i1:47-1519(+)